MDNLTKYINDDNVLNIYVFGSRVYGTATPESDTDVIMVVKEWFDSIDINIHVYTVEQFQLLVNRHDIQAMECVFAPKEWVLKNKQYFSMPIFSAPLLRVAISTIASNSWVKGKKKLVVAGDYDMHLAIKSIFHSLRILDFGIQIANTMSIQNFGSMNYILDDLKKMSQQYQREDLWMKIDDKYRKLFKSKSTEFKLLAPKDTSEKDVRAELVNILHKYSVKKDEEMMEEILNLIKN